MTAFMRADARTLFEAIDTTRVSGLRDRALLGVMVYTFARIGAVVALDLGDRFTNHTFRATGITAYLKNEGQLEHAQFMAGHAPPRTTKLYDRRKQEASLDEVERIIL